MRKQIKIRPYQERDLDDVIAIYLDAIKNVASKDYTADQVNAWAQVDRNAWSAEFGSCKKFSQYKQNATINFASQIAGRCIF